MKAALALSTFPYLVQDCDRIIVKTNGLHFRFLHIGYNLHPVFIGKQYVCMFVYVCIVCWLSVGRSLLFIADCRVFIVGVNCRKLLLFARLACVGCCWLSVSVVAENFDCWCPALRIFLWTFTFTYRGCFLTYTDVSAKSNPALVAQCVKGLLPR